MSPSPRLSKLLILLSRDTSAELHRKADKFDTMPAGFEDKARGGAVKTSGKQASAKEPAHKNRAKTEATKPARQPDLVAAIRDLNVAWPTAAIEAATAGLAGPQKAELRHHLPDMITKLQWLADSIKLESPWTRSRSPISRSFSVTADACRGVTRPGTLLHTGV